MPASTRDLAITYGSLSVGGTTDYVVWGGWHYERDKDTALVTFRLLVTASSAANLITARATVEAALSLPRQAILLSISGTTELDLDPADNTGFNAAPSIRVVTDAPENTSLSVLYDVRIPMGLPAGYGSQTGIRELTTTRTDTPAGRGTVTFQGVVTAAGSNGARAQFAAIRASILTDKAGSGKELGVVTLEAVTSEISTDDANKVCTFRCVYEEVIYGQSLTGSPDDSEIVRPTLAIERAQRSKDNPDDNGPTTPESGGSNQTLTKSSGSPSPPVELAGTFSCWLLKSSSQDLSGKWTSKVKPWLVAQIKTFAQGGRVAINELTPTYDPFENKISARISATAFTGTGLIEFRLETEDAISYGRSIQSVWSAVPTDAYVYQGQAVITRTETRGSRVLGDAPPTDLAIPRLPTGAGWVGLGPKVRRVPKRIGLAPDQVAVTDLVVVTTYRYVTAAPAVSGDKYARR